MIKLLLRMYSVPNRLLRVVIRQYVARAEGGEIHSTTLREIFARYYEVRIGMYTHGSCFVPGEFDRFTTIGRYCSIARGSRAFNINHRMDFKSTHGFFFNPRLGLCGEGHEVYVPLLIGNDVWLGANALILPHVKEIGHGAVVAAGAVVGGDVPPYAVVTGNPARVVRYRFPKEVIDQLLASKWWDQPIELLDVTQFTKPVKAD